MLAIFDRIDPTVLSLLKITLIILIFFTTLFNIWKLIKDSSFVRLMLTRTYSWWGIYLTILLLFCLFPALGHVGLCLIALQGFREIIKNSGELKISKELLGLCYLLIVTQFLASALAHNVLSLTIIPFFGILIITIYCILFETVETTVRTPPFLLWTMILTASGLAHLSHLLSLGKSVSGVSTQGLLVYFIFLTQSNDVLQFIWGTLLGKRLISPVISPKKTWEGLIGAVVSTIGIAYGLRFLTPFNGVQSVIIGIILPVFGFWGDLTISALKRNLKVKDMGALIPGHGGILDRVDSILLSSLIYYYLVYYWFLL